MSTNDTRMAEAWDQGWQAGMQASASYVWPSNPYRTAQAGGNGHESAEGGPGSVTGHPGAREGLES